MAIYQLEERVYFDGAVAVDLGEITDSELHDNASDLDSLSELVEENDNSEYFEIESAEYLNSIAASGMLDYANIFNDNTFPADSELNKILQNFIDTSAPSEQLAVADNSYSDYSTTTFAHRTLVSGIADPEIILTEYNPDSVIITDIESPEVAEIEYSTAFDTENLTLNSNSTVDSFALNDISDNYEVSISDYQESLNSTSTELSVEEDISVTANNDLIISLDPNSDNGTESTSIGPDATDASPPESMNNEQLIINNEETASFTVAPSGSQLATDNQQSEIIFINSSVMDAEEIVDDLSENVEVVYLNKDTDGVQQITDYLADKTDIDTIRIISHGNEGYFVLNGEVIDNDFVSENADTIALWSDALADDGDIMIYGCNLAATSEGQELVQQIADITGADVAASDDSTGISGDWDLEYSIGTVEAAAVSIAGYEHNLTNYLVSNTDGGTDVENSLGWAVEQANSNIGADEITFDSSIDGSEIVLDSTLNITDDVTISGNGTENTVISAEEGNIVFNIDDGVDDSQISVSINDLSLGRDGCPQPSDSTIEDDTEDGALGTDAPYLISNSEDLTITASNIDGIDYVFAHISNEVANPKVILISSILDDVDDLVAAVNDNVIALEYDPEVTNLIELSDMVETALNGRKASSIAFANHSTGDNEFYLTDSEVISLGSTLTDTDQQEFWKDIAGNIVEDGRIDLLACNLADGTIGEILIASLESVAGINFAASTDETGNPENGGNWILETDNIDSEEYFNKTAIENYSELLSNDPIYTINAPSGASDFGISIFTYDNTLYVGAYGSNTVYTYTIGDWSAPTETINAPSGASGFGSGVFAYDNTLYVGAWTSNTVYTYAIGDWSAPTETINAPSGISGFGVSLCAYDNTLLVGAYYSSKVCEYTIGNWSDPVAIINSPGGTMRFGESLCAYNNTLYVGANNIVYTYTIGDLSTPTGIIHAPGGASGFGTGIFAYDNTLYVGAWTSNTVYTYAIGDWSAPTETINGPSDASRFGWSTNAYDNTLLVGAWSNSVYIYDTTPSYIITASAGDGGSIDPVGDVAVPEGDSQTFTIAASDGYEIDNVLVDGISQGAITDYTFTGLTEDHTITAEFAEITYTITASASTGGTIDPQGIITLPEGASQAFVIEANEGYQIGVVLVDDAPVVLAPDNTYTFTGLTEDHTITATFAEIPTYIITASAGDGGSIDPVGDVAVPEGDSQTFTIAASDGYEIDNVLVDGISQGAITDYTFTGLTEDHTITAEFAEITYTITASASTGGTIDPQGIITLPEGASQAFVIEANEGYQIGVVLVDDAPVVLAPDNTYTFTGLTEDHTITAEFAEITYTITASASTGGTIDPQGIITLPEGASQAFVIEANEGYQIGVVLVDDAPVVLAPDNTYTFTGLTEDHTITATFAEIPTYIITASAGDGGSIDPVGDVAVPEGDSQTFTIAASDGYEIDNVLVDEISQGAITDYTFTGLTEDHTITAEFVAEAEYFYYRTQVTEGDWSDVSTWEVSTDGINWVDATETPDADNSDSITVLSGASVTVDSSISIDQTVVESGGEIIVNQGYTFTVVNGSGIDLTVEGDGIVDVNGSLDASEPGSTIVYTGAGSLYLAEESPDLGIFTPGTSTVFYDGTDQTIDNVDYYNLVISGSGTKALTGNQNIDGDLTIGSGTSLDVSPSNYDIYVGGNWVNHGTFLAKNGTAVFDGGGNQNLNSGGSSFYNFTVNKSGGSLIFDSDVTVTGTYALQAGTVNTGIYDFSIDRKVINKAAAFNDGSDTNTHTSWRTSIDKNIAEDDNDFYVKTELGELDFMLLASSDKVAGGSYGGVFASNGFGADSGGSNGEYGIGTGADAGSGKDGEYGLSFSVNDKDGEYGAGNNKRVEKYEAGKQLSKNPNTPKESAGRDVTFNFDELNFINIDSSINSYFEKHSLFKSDFEKTLDNFLIGC